MNINTLVHINLQSKTKDIPNEILKFCSKIKYDNTTSEEDYIIKTPYETLTQKSAVCYDIVELESLLFEKANYEFKTYFAYEGLPITKYPTHTFLIFREDNNYYWIECSWQSYKGIHGKFKDYSSSISYVTQQLKKSNNWTKVNIKEYKRFNYKGMNINQFGNYIVHNF